MKRKLLEVVILGGVLFLMFAGAALQSPFAVCSLAVFLFILALIAWSE